MPITIDYKKLLIIFDEWDDDPLTLDKLLWEMTDNDFEWDDHNWFEYLQQHYNLNINVTYKCRTNATCCELMFDNTIEMDLFILYFM